MQQEHSKSILTIYSIKKYIYGIKIYIYLCTNKINSNALTAQMKCAFVYTNYRKVMKTLRTKSVATNAQQKPLTVWQK